MTVKELEALTGLTRANIRFYEAEGLLNPRRLNNNFREYSREDLEILQRIRLLRSMDVSLQDIKALQRGDKTFRAVLDAHILLLERRSSEYARFRAVCTRLRDDGADYASLDPRPYLSELEQEAASPAAIPAGDALSVVRSPERRGLARALDWALCMALWTAAFALIFHRNPLNLPAAAKVTLVTSLLWFGLHGLAASGLMLLTEAILLACFGTTPGKRLLGFRVTALHGGRLSLRDAFARTWQVLLQGWGLGLPVVSAVTCWKSWQAMDYTAALPWEKNSLLVFRENDRRSAAVCAGTVVLLLTAAGILMQLPGRLPIYRGPLTVAEYSENYNGFIDYHRLTGEHRLTSGGRYALQNCGDCRHPEVEYITENGVLTGIRMTYHCTSGTVLPDPRPELLLAALSFGGAQPGYHWYSRSRLTDPILQYGFRSGQVADYTVAGLRFCLTTELSGYRYVDGELFTGFAANDPGGGPTTGLTKPADGSFVRVTFTILPAAQF